MILINKHTELISHMTSMPINPVSVMPSAYYVHVYPFAGHPIHFSIIIYSYFRKDVIWHI